MDLCLKDGKRSGALKQSQPKPTLAYFQKFLLCILKPHTTRFKDNREEAKDTYFDCTENTFLI